MYKKSDLTKYGIVTGTVISMALTAVMPAAAQRLPNRLHGPARIDSSPPANQRSRTIDQDALSRSAPDATGSGQIVEKPAQNSAPATALPAPKTRTPLPTQRASNAPIPTGQPSDTAIIEGRTAQERKAGATRLTPVVVQRAPNADVRVTPEPTPAANPGDGPGEVAQRTDERVAEFRKERFRRRAAEAAQKEIEQMADQLREQLGKEVTARRSAESVAAELVSRASLEDQIDQERARLRTAKIKTLEQRRAGLEREVKALTRRLAEERSRRRQLEEEKAVLAKSVAAAQQNTSSGAAIAALKAQVTELERKLNAAEWARKLAEAQLSVLTKPPGTKPATTSSQSN